MHAHLLRPLMPDTPLTPAAAATVSTASSCCCESKAPTLITRGIEGPSNDTSAVVSSDTYRPTPHDTTASSGSGNQVTAVPKWACPGPMAVKLWSTPDFTVNACKSTKQECCLLLACPFFPPCDTSAVVSLDTCRLTTQHCQGAAECGNQVMAVQLRPCHVVSR